VTAIASELTAPRRGLLEALRNSIPRDQFLAGLYILGCANGLLGRILLTLRTDGWTGLLSVDISVIVLFACFAGISLMLSDDREPLRSADLVVAAVFLGLVVLPSFALSWVAVTGLSLYVLLCTNGSYDRTRGALILLALTVPMLWSRLLFQFFARAILEVDASLAAWLLGTDRVGNVVNFADSSGSMVVLPACSSLANMSLAFLCWVSVTQWANHRWSPLDILWTLLACASVIAVNVARIALTGLSQSNYEIIHGPWGNMIGGVIILALTVGISVLSARRELFSRA
jgi:exosortase/archaeosortase family protein